MKPLAYKHKAGWQVVSGSWSVRKPKRIERNLRRHVPINYGSTDLPTNKSMPSVKQEIVGADLIKDLNRKRFSLVPEVHLVAKPSEIEIFSENARGIIFLWIGIQQSSQNRKVTVLYAKLLNYHLKTLEFLQLTTTINAALVKHHAESVFEVFFAHLAICDYTNLNELFWTCLKYSQLMGHGLREH